MERIIHKILSISTISALLFSSFVPFASADNTHSIDLELGSQQYLSVADTAPLSITGDMTIDMQVKLESDPPLNTNYTLVSKYNFDTDNRSYRLLYGDVATVKTFTFQFSDDGTGAAHVSTATFASSISSGAWHHIRLVYDNAGTADLYIDGTQQTQAAGLLTSIFNGTADFAIGATVANSSQEWFDGLIDEVRIWNNINTSSSRVSELCGTDPNLVGYWKLNNALTDSSGNAATLTNNGSAVFSTDVPFVPTCLAGGGGKKRRVIFIF